MPYRTADIPGASPLVEKQHEFLMCACHLIPLLSQRGYYVTGGELERSREQAALNAAKGIGISNSLHMARLAIDLRLYDHKGVYLDRSEQYKEAGELWKSLHPLARWGGDFSKPDGNHFSFEHEGRK